MVKLLFFSEIWNRRSIQLNHVYGYNGLGFGLGEFKILILAFA